MLRIKPLFILCAALLTVTPAASTGQRHLQQNGDAVRGESDCEKHRFPVPESGNHQSVPGLRPELRAG